MHRAPSDSSFRPRKRTIESSPAFKPEYACQKPDREGGRKPAFSRLVSVPRAFFLSLWERSEVRVRSIATGSILNAETIDPPRYRSGY